MSPALSDVSEREAELILSLPREGGVRYFGLCLSEGLVDDLGTHGVEVVGCAVLLDPAWQH